MRANLPLVSRSGTASTVVDTGLAFSFLCITSCPEADSRAFARSVSSSNGIADRCQRVAAEFGCSGVHHVTQLYDDRDRGRRIE